MADNLTKKQRSYNMSMIKGKNTRPELVLRKALSLKNIKGYRINSALAGRPDIVFTRSKLVIFIDGCFWHKCPKHFKKPKSNMIYWKPKIERNVQRAKEVNKYLKKNSWKVIRFWEHEIIKNPEKCINKILKLRKQ